MRSPSRQLSEIDPEHRHGLRADREDPDRTLEKNRFGRATFLPLSAISAGNGFNTPGALKEPGAIGIAADLVHVQPEYQTLARYLLGRVLVVDHIDNAIAIARKYRHSIRIVTPEGDLLNPGGSMSVVPLKTPAIFSEERGRWRN